MAEIQVEQKERSVWPWLLIGLLALALIAWLLTRDTDGADDGLAVDSVGGLVIERPSAANSAAATGTPAAVTDYLVFVEPQRARGDADSTHGVTSRTAGAIRAMVNTTA